MELEGVGIEVEVDSRDVLVKAGETNAADASNAPNAPNPRIENIRGGDDFHLTELVTDDDGEATFEVDGPRRYDRLDQVDINPDCDCSSRTIEIAWTAGDPVLVQAIPDFHSYQYLSGNNIRFNADYYLYDQYGTALSNTNSRQTGRGETTVRAMLEYTVYSVNDAGIASFNSNGDVYLAEDDMPFRGGRLTDSVTHDIPSNSTDDYLVLFDVSIFSNSNDDDDDDGDDEGDVKYLDSKVVVWIVEEATSANDQTTRCVESGLPDDVTIDDVEVNLAEQEFRTCFTVWKYDSNDRFLGDSGSISIGEFEELLMDVTEVGDIVVFSYSDDARGLSIFDVSR